MTTNHPEQPQTPPVSFGELGRGRGSAMKTVRGELPADTCRLAVDPAAGSEYAPLASALGGEIVRPTMRTGKTNLLVGIIADPNPSPIYIDFTRPSAAGSQISSDVAATEEEVR